MLARRRTGSFALGCALLLGLGACTRSEARWAADLDSPDPFVRAVAALSLAEIAPTRGPQVAGVLLETVDRVELGLGPQAGRALQRVAPFAGEALVSALVEDEFMTLERRAALLEALAGTGPQAVEIAVAAVRGSGLERTGALVVVLERAGPPAVPMLTELARSDPDAGVRSFAARGLAAIGARAEQP